MTRVPAEIEARFHCLRRLTPHAELHGFTAFNRVCRMCNESEEWLRMTQIPVRERGPVAH